MFPFIINVDDIHIKFANRQAKYWMLWSERKIEPGNVNEFSAERIMNESCKSRKINSLFRCEQCDLNEVKFDLSMSRNMRKYNT